MQLKTVALIALIMITTAYAIRIYTQFEFIVNFPFKYILASVETWALIFFFAMLYKNASDE